MFVVGALEHERPFLGPLYKFMTMHPRNAVRRIPPYVGFILRYLAGQIQLQRHYECGTYYSTDSCAPRVDAQASDVRAGLGGWFPTRGRDGVISVWGSPWFSMEVAQKDFPWVYERGNKPSLVISTIEALAIVIALRLRNGQEGSTESKKITVVPSITDNRGNGAVLNKMMSTKFPSSAVLMELAVYMKRRRIRPIVEWAPREFNRESDNLANGITEGFNQALELKIRPEEISWEILPEALEAGREAERSYGAAKESGKLPNRSKRERRRDTRERLRVVDPW